MKKQSVFIVGAGGMVGATAAHALAIKEVVHDIALIDVAQELVHGQAMDISHATAFTKGVRVRVGNYDEIKDDDIIVITCGLAQRPGQSRLELLSANAKIVSDVVNKVMEGNKSVYIIMVANPVDVLTKIALEVSGLPKERVFGTGTMLDSARYRVALAHELGISQRDVIGYILGEHGDSSFPALSGTTIGGIPLAEFPGFRKSSIETIDKDIRDAAYRIIEAKKSTFYGIGSVITHTIEALLSDAGSVLPVCSLADYQYGLRDVVIGLPSLVSSRGVQILENYPLSANELESLHKSAGIIKNAYKGLALGDVDGV